MVVISEPGKEVAGGGSNAKYVKECTELYLGDKGIEKLRGFEPFVNLECLWLNGNQLKKINNLDSNFRIRTLYAQNNQICTLRGSLCHFKFLEVLDLAGNQLRDLDKQLDTLAKFQFLSNLNLKGNPCAEEPDYRLLVIHRLPQLKVLDLHVVTAAERQKATAVIGGDVQALTVAFMQRVPAYNPAWDEKVPEKSVLEQQLAQEAAQIRDIKADKAYEADNKLFKHNPYPDIVIGRTLPPNAGMRDAQDTTQRMTRARGTGRHAYGAKPPPLVFTSQTAPYSCSGAVTSWEDSHAEPVIDCDSSVFSRQGTTRSRAATSIWAQSGVRHPPGLFKDHDPSSTGPAYTPKDVLHIFSCKPGHLPDELNTKAQRQQQHSNGRMGAYGPGSMVGNSCSGAAGTIKFEAVKYAEFLKQRTHGREKWRSEQVDVQL